ncbi:putative hypermethylated in cancer 1 protein [Iris pallida]|uniref:Hypermethylated in cancer 1 protein n=1 Tax=Iris pallida TaxID=29817 RepID=A0AAX6HFM0_IRIPA|nr:putative hypermethylated in cancer 1 protein [Iris pallida]
MPQPYTRSQLSEKLRRLRKKYRSLSARIARGAQDPSRLAPHDRDLLHLCTRLWHPDHASASPFSAPDVAAATAPRGRLLQGEPPPPRQSPRPCPAATAAGPPVRQCRGVGDGGRRASGNSSVSSCCPRCCGGGGGRDENENETRGGEDGAGRVRQGAGGDQDGPGEAGRRGWIWGRRAGAEVAGAEGRGAGRVCPEAEADARAVAWLGLNRENGWLVFITGLTVEILVV